MKKILIIGSSYSIKNTFSKKFNKHSVNFISFREGWLKKNYNHYDIIVISGFHHNKINKNLSEIRDYIIQYSEFLINLENFSNKLILISTYIPSKISFSRIVFFYKKLSSIMIGRKKIRILSFKKIIDERNKDNISIKILKYLGFKFVKQSFIIRCEKNYVLNKVPDPVFFLLKVKKNMLIERIVRLFDFG